MFKRYILPVLTILCVAGVAALAQTFAPSLPAVNSPSYCSSTVNNVCVNTVPAGPALTGAETIPADTNLAGGRNPQAVKIPISILGLSLPAVFETHPTTASSVTITNNVGLLFVTTATTTKAGLTVTMPSAPLDGQKFVLATDRIISAIGFSPNSGQTINGTPQASFTLSPQNITTTAGATSLTWMYRASNTTWYRII